MKLSSSKRRREKLEAEKAFLEQAIKMNLKEFRTHNKVSAIRFDLRETGQVARVIKVADVIVNCSDPFN